jgi:hypothetical membrane protein
MSSAAAQEPNALIWAARLAVAGPVLCLTLVAVLHVLEPEVNDSDAVSEYALGDYGWLMNIAFFSGAAGIGALAFALHRSLARSKTAIAGIVLLSIAAVAWVLLGAGNIDPEGADATTHGLIHGIGFFLGLPTRLAAPLVLAAAFRRDERWADHRRVRVHVLTAPVSTAIPSPSALNPCNEAGSGSWNTASRRRQRTSRNAPRPLRSDYRASVGC